MKIERRTLVRTTAWATPVIATMAPIPVFAASGCAPVPFSAGWAASSIGILDDRTGMYGVVPHGADGVPRFVLSRDNALTVSETSEVDMAIVHMETMLRLLPGKPYTFTLSVGSGYADNTPSTAQNNFLLVQTILPNGTVNDHLRLVKGDNPNTNVGRLDSWRPLSRVTPGVVIETFSFAFTPPMGVNQFGFRYRFLLPARGKVGGGIYTGSNDIAVSAPTITGC